MRLVMLKINIDRVIWHYRDGCVPKSKVGIYKGTVRHTVKHWGQCGAVQMAWVHFEGNKNPVKVPLKDLVKEEK